MKGYFLAFLILLTFSLAHAQTAEEQLAGMVCDSMDDADFTLPENELNDMVMQSIQKVYQANTELIMEAISGRMEEDSERSQQEAALEVGNGIRMALMDDCENFQRITMFKGKPVPEISDLTRKIGDEINEKLTGLEAEGSLDQAAIDEAISTATDKYAGELEKHFGEVYSDEFSDELIAYMQTESRPYMRWMVRGK